jgi:predicted DNA-binding ribbon-helix-helix protein
MQSVVAKRSIVLAGHKTSVSLEDAFWDGLKDIARGHNKTLSDLVADIDTRRLDGNLSSAIRLFVLGHFRGQQQGNGTGRSAADRPMPQFAPDQHT